MRPRSAAAAKRRTRHSRGQRGAAVVEFALVVPLLLALICGVIDYGMWFNESFNVRQGVREGARAGVVQNFAFGSCSGSDSAKLVCKTKALIAPSAGTAYVRVVVPAAGWKYGERRLVCGSVRVDGLTGLVPLPSDRLVSSLTSMSIEQDLSSTIAAGSYSDADPSGNGWSWCA